MRIKSPTVIACALACCLSTVTPALAQGNPSTLVVTKDGPVQGKLNETTVTFLGVPYAQSPVGPLRWRPPVPTTRHEGVLEAKTFGNHCLQPGSLSSQTNASEDCLFLNVYVPRNNAVGNASESTRSPPLLPVMVWIYGGANAEGASEYYDPTPLVDAGGVIVVTLNYRVGPFGFLAHPALDAEGHAAVNYGVMDQQLALKWVQSNVSAFGGDPLQVTLFGESAGGLDVTTHLVSPLSRGLFDRAIIESGAYQLMTPSLASSEALGVTFANNAGCASQTAACLRALSANDILLNAGTINTASSSYSQSTVDGQILVETQLSSLEAGRFTRVPVIQGNNSNEGRAFLPPNLDAAGYQASVTGFAASVGKSPSDALALYPLSNYPNPFEAAAAALGDFAFACSAELSNQLLSLHVHTWAYEFADPNAGSLGADHGAELTYLFDLSAGATGTATGPANLPPPSRRLARMMRGYWTNFARLSNPNSFALPMWQQTVFETIQLLKPPVPKAETVSAFSAEHNCSFWNGS